MASTDPYDLAVIGAGTGGLVSAFIADSLGARVVLIEREKVGGECLWTGCVPSKTLIKSAKVFETIKRSEEFGVHVEATRLIWSAVKMRIAAVRDEIKALERAELSRANIEVVMGTARFTDAHTMHITSQLGEHTLQARKFILATGTKARVPEIDGLSETKYITHEHIYDLPSPPRSLLIIGGGPIACEFAQAFVRFGSRVTVIQHNERLLPKEDAEISAACQLLLEQEGVTIHIGATVNRVYEDEKGKHLEFQAADDSIQSVQGAELLVATGKAPDTEALNLAAAGVATDEHGITVDDTLRTTANHIWACGDATGKYLFTHVAEYQAKIAAQNALLPVKSKADYRVVPWTTFTDPEISHLGLTQEEVEQEYGQCKVYHSHFDHLDRAIIEGETYGFLKVITTGSGRIVGAHIIGPSAGESIHSFVPAVRDGALLQEMAETIHVYPTLSEIGHRAGNEYYRELLNTASAQRLLSVLKRL